MAFNNDQIIKLAANVLAAGTLDSSGNNWYETRNPNNFIIDPESIWSDLPLMKEFHAANFSQAVAHAVANPNYFELVGINEDGTFNDTTAIRMTPVAGTNNATYIAYNVYNDPSSGVRKNWILPHLLPRPNGSPSNAYQATIWSGPPSNGQRILTSTGNDGNWVSHFWNAAGGLLLISPNDAPPSTSFPSTDIWVTGICYSGQTSSGGGFSGNTILLQDPEGNWRVRNDYPFLRLERKELNSNGDYVWNSYGNFGASIEVDGVRLSRPYSINVDLAADNLNDNDPINLRSAFRVSGTEQDFTYGNSQQRTVLETKRGTELVRADAVRNEAEFENRPLFDQEIILDNTDTPEVGSFKEYSWVSNINYTQDADFIRFNQLAFEVLEASDVQCPVRISVETLDGELIQENLPFTSLNAGIDGGFNLKEGYHFYNINPKYTDVRTAATITRLQIASGYKVKLSAGTYNYTDTRDGQVHSQVVPRQKARVEFLNYVNIFDQSNFREEVYKNAGILLDNGIHAYNRDFSDNVYPLVSVGEHNNAFMPVLGNYEDTTFIASGTGGIVALFDDPTTRTQIWTNGDRDRLEGNETPSYFKLLSEIEIDLNGVFDKELNTLKWNIVNAEYFLPLLRNDNPNPVGYRTTITSTVVDHQFQESQSRYEFADGVITPSFTVPSTIDALEPSYVKLRLPRQRFTVDSNTPRKVKFQFQNPIKIYGYYKNVTNPSDPVGTGTFVPSIKAEVTRIFEEPLVTGDALEQRVDQIEGDNEWRIATDQNLPTLHVEDSLLVLADEDGEWLLWSDIDNLYSDQDLHQWVFTNGTECYFELGPEQGQVNNGLLNFYAAVVHVPYDTVTTFEVSFGWHEHWSSMNNVNYGWFTLYLDSGGRGFDHVMDINIPKNASMNWRFRRRRDGSYSYIATPMNDNLASVWLGEGNNIPNIPEDPNPPIEVQVNNA
jgi:hypothetical protein